MVKITKREQTVPLEIKRPVRQAFEAQARKDFFEAEFKSAKKIIDDYYTEVPFEVSDSKSLATEYGKITATTRSNSSVDKEKLMELIESGRINAITVLNLVSTFKIEDLKTVLGAVASEIITENPATHFTFTGKPEFKAKVAQEMGIILGTEIPEVEVVVEKPKTEKPKPMPVKSSVSVDSELDDLLNTMSGKVDSKPKAKGKKK